MLVAAIAVYRGREHMFRGPREGVYMTIQEALHIENDFYEIQSPSEEEVFRFTEAMDYLIRETGEPRYMMHLGGYYYEQKQFDLALKYYEMAAERGSLDADVCLGYIWYYGRTGERNFEKAFHYYTKGMEAGDLQCAYKIADMYRNGYFVEKDYARYCEIIENLYPKVKDAAYVNEPLPEIFTRLARIRMEQKRFDEAEDLLLSAKDFLAERICHHPFFGDLNIMKWLVEDLYKLPPKLEPMDINLFNMFSVLREPVQVFFWYERKKMEIKAVMENDACVISFNGHWYRNVDDFFAKASIDGDLLTSLYHELYGWEVLNLADY